MRRVCAGSAHLHGGVAKATVILSAESDSSTSGSLSNNFFTGEVCALLPPIYVLFFCGFDRDIGPLGPFRGLRAS